MSAFSKGWAVPVVLVGVMALTISACGDDASEGPKGRVSVQQVFRPEQAYGVEGVVSYVVIEQAGAEILRRHVVGPSIHRPQPLLDEGLEPGPYRVNSYQRNCDGSCAAREPPSARCSTDVEVVDHRPVDVLVQVHPNNETCKIDTGFIELG